MMATDLFRTETPDDARWLIGHLSEYQTLLAALDTEPGMLALTAEPLSGASTMVRTAATELTFPGIYVDSRRAADEIDLATLIADAAVEALRPEALSWWRATAPAGDLEGLRLHRALGSTGRDLEDLRLGSGRGERLLTMALELTTSLAEGPVCVALDHLDDLFVHSRAKQEPLGTLRAARQASPSLHLLLVGRAGGHIENALSDRRHPLFHAGEMQRVRRADPSRFAEDLVIGRPWTEASIPTVRVAAELAAGVPAYVWRIVDFAADAETDDPIQQATHGWRHLRDATATSVAGEFALLRAIHPVAQAVVSATAAGLGPYTAPVNDGRIRDALKKLESIGVMWQPRSRGWAVADPLLAAWSRDNAAPWIQRRARATTSGPGKDVPNSARNAAPQGRR